MLQNKNSGPAILFDWDGVVVDSRVPHEESWNRLAADENFTLPSDYFLKGFGRKNDWIIPHILNWTHNPSEIHRLSLKKEKIFRQVVSENGLEPLGGVLEFLKMLTSNSVPCVIASSTHRENIITALEVLNFQHFFINIVSAEDVDQGKPHPEVFLKAAALTGRENSKCIVIEDAKVGIQAAIAGGLKVIAVTNTQSAESLQSADKIVERLDSLTIEDIQALVK